MTTATPHTVRKPKPRTKRRELVSRSGWIREWNASVFIRAEARHGIWARNSMRHLSFCGTLTEPIKGVSEFLLTAFADAGPAVGKTGISSVGSIISMGRCVDAVIQLSEVEFQLLSSMAAAGKATSVYMCFQEPKYGSALIKSCSVSSRPPEDEQ